MQATNSFLDQPVGLYPLGTLQSNQITAKDGYAVLFRYGVAVLIGLTPIAEDEVLRGLRPRVQGAFPSVDTETATLEIAADDRIGLGKLRDAFLGHVLALAPHVIYQPLAMECGCVNACTIHGHDHARAWSSRIPVADLKSFWGALGCACWAV